MKATIFKQPGEITIETVPDPELLEATDAIITVTYTCICGSDLWPYRGLNDRPHGSRIGHEFIGVVEAIGNDVSKLKVGDTVIAPFRFSDGTCPECNVGFSSNCRHGGAWGANGIDGGQGEKVRVPLADGCLFVVPADKVTDELMPAYLALSDVMCTGHHAAVSASVGKESTVVVIGDGAVGLCAVLASKRLGAKRIILMSRHEERAELGRSFGASEIIAARGEDATQAIMDMTDNLGADAVLECVGTAQSWQTAMETIRPGGTIGFVGVPHDVPPADLTTMLRKNIGIKGGIAPAASYIPELLADVVAGKLDPGPVFDMTISLQEIAQGYEAMDTRKAIKVMVRP